jgi:hypothetical protein
MQEQNVQVVQNIQPLVVEPEFTSSQEKHEYIQKILGETSPFLIKNILQRFDALDHGLNSKKEILDLLTQQAANSIFEEPGYSKVAVRFLLEKIDVELQHEGITSFYDSFVNTCSHGITSPKVMEFVEANKDFFNEVADHSRSLQFEYFGLRTVYDRYLIKHPKKRTVLESPQYFFMRVACGLAKPKKKLLSFTKCFPVLISCRAHRHCSTPEQDILNCLLVSCWILPWMI